MGEPEKSSRETGVRSSGPASKGRPILKWALVALPLGYLWFRLIDNLRLEWSSNPQYSYGLVVPLLVMGLLLRRWLHGASQNKVAANPWPAILLGGTLAFLYLPTRLIEAATPEWRPIQWLLAFEAVGLTLYAIYLAGGKGRLRQFAFPVAFFLVAVPWPTLLEAPVIQGLSRMNAALVVVVMSFLNVPAIQHGNVIEVSTGLVGINDACSGIRSLQSSLMISLFLGEFYLFNWRRRILLVPIGFALAMLLNLCRASLLTWIAANKGVAAIAEYHDEAGLTILLVCTALLWGAALLLNRRNVPMGVGRPMSPDHSEPSAADNNGRLRLNRLGLVLIVWLVAVESGVELWYRIRESHLKTVPDWSVKFPVENTTFKPLPLTEDEHELLRFDDGQKGQWQEPDGTFWQAFYFDWKPGRIAGYLAKRHTPDICMTASGLKMLSGPDLIILDVNQVQLPMRHYVFDSSDGQLQVYQCHWEAGMGQDSYTADESARFNLIRGAWAGRGNQGQKVLEIIVAGCNDPQVARPALMRELNKLIQVKK
jgi:exosortase